jgi:hypothetical protein
MLEPALRDSARQPLPAIWLSSHAGTPVTPAPRQTLGNTLSNAVTQPNGVIPCNALRRGKDAPTAHDCSGVC